MHTRCFPSALVAALVAAFSLLTATGASAADGTMTWGVHVSLTPAFFDPADATGTALPLMVYYGVHDALVRPMPGTPMGNALAQSWSMSKDGLVYEFVLRRGVKFHNGDVMTAEDVKFSFERYRGASAALLKQKVAAVEIPDPARVRFRLKEPWPDFMTFYATPATGAAWIVPKKYVEKVGDDGFKKQPVGAGPYRFVSFKPGVELVLEASERYWRKKPAVKRLVFKVIPDESTRLAALKAGEIDIAYSVRGELAEKLRTTPGLALKPALVQGPFCLYFPDQWDDKSPWHDERVRRAASLAIDRKNINEAVTLGFSEVTGNSIVPKGFDFYWQPPAPEFDPDKAKRLLAEAGLRSGFDAGNYNCDLSYSNIGESVVDNLRAVGIRSKLRPIERAAFIKEFSEKKYKNIIQAGPGAFGNAATRIEAHLVKGGVFSYGSYPDIDALYQQQAGELDRSRREAMLFKIQQLMVERTIYAPIWQLAFINGIGPRVGESGFGRIPLFPYTAPYEDMTIKGT